MNTKKQTAARPKVKQKIDSSQRTVDQALWKHQDTHLMLKWWDKQPLLDLNNNALWDALVDYFKENVRYTA